MDCTLSAGTLPAFHFATLEEPLRAELERHLTGCPRCLSEYLAFKRAVETADDDGALPSETTRARVRRDVARELARRRVRRIAGAAAAAMVAAVILGIAWTVSPHQPPPATPSPSVPPGVRVDTALPPDFAAPVL